MSILAHTDRPPLKIRNDSFSQAQRKLSISCLSLFVLHILYQYPILDAVLAYQSLMVSLPLSEKIDTKAPESRAHWVVSTNRSYCLE